MALIMRIGPEEKFVADKMTPGEWAVSLDTKFVRMCFAPGVVYRMATYESFEEDMIQIQQILATCEDIQTAVEAFESLAQQHANDAAASATAAGNSALLSESWAVGGTGTRPGEDTDNAEYWAGVAQAAADVQVMTPTQIGIGKPDDVTIGVSNGTFSVKNAPTADRLNRVHVTTVDVVNVGKWTKVGSVELNDAYSKYTAILSIISKNIGSASLLCIKVAIDGSRLPDITNIYLTYLDFGTSSPAPAKDFKIVYNGAKFELWYNPSNGYMQPEMTIINEAGVGGASKVMTYYSSQPYVDTPSAGTIVTGTALHAITNSLLATVPGTALDAVQGKALDDKITTINQNLGFNTTEHLAGFYNGKQLYAKTVIVTKAVSATWQNIYTESAATLVLVDYGKSYVHDTTNGFFMLLESKEGSGVISRCTGKSVQCYGFVSASYEFILSIMYTKN